MTLKSSEIHDYSCRNSAVPVPFVVSSSTCHAFHPLVVRPVVTMLDMFLKIVFNSPEFNRSIIFSMYLFSMTRKMIQFLRCVKIGGWKIYWFNIGPTSFPNGYCFWWKNRQVLVIVVLLWHVFGMQNHSYSISTHILWAELLEFLSHCCSIRDHFVRAMRDSDQGVRNVFVCKQFWSQLRTYSANNRLQLPIRVQFGCFLGFNFLVPMLLHLLAMCTHDRPLYLWIVRILQCLSSRNTVRFQQQSEILHPYIIYSICLVVTAFQFVLHTVATEDLCEQGHHNPMVFLSWSRWARMRNSTVLSQRVAPFYREKFRILRISVRLLRKDWAGLQRLMRKIVSIVSNSAQ